MSKSIKIPETMQQLFDEISNLTNSYCNASLNQEYADLCKTAIAALCRKRPSPLISGNSKTWGCGIVYALGQANFLFDNSQNPHVSPTEICAWFGVSKSTAGNKAKLIRDMLKIDFYNHKWKLMSQMEKSSFVWMIQVNGFIVDVRNMPLEVQYQAYEKGLIPYVPSLQNPIKK
jgi:hypothetical protein